MVIPYDSPAARPYSLPLFDEDCICRALSLDHLTKTHCSFFYCARQALDICNLKLNHLILKVVVQPIILMPGDLCLSSWHTREHRKKPAYLGCGWESVISTSWTRSLSHPPQGSWGESDSYLHTLIILRCVSMLWLLSNLLGLLLELYQKVDILRRTIHCDWIQGVGKWQPTGADPPRQR